MSIPETRPPRMLVIVPAYNESANIPAVLKDLRTHVPEADVLVVDDCSDDDTVAVARSGGARVLELATNLGVGGAMQAGYMYAFENEYDMAVQFDGDNQHRANQIPILIENILSDKADLVIGSRVLNGMTFRFNPFRFVGSRILSWLVSFIIKRKITDPTSGFRAAGKRVIAFFAHNYPQTYLADTSEALVWTGRQGMRLMEVSARMRQRRAGASATGTLMGVVHMIRIILALLVDCIEPRPTNGSDSWN